jgi:SAM-dependent methyltransferase
VACPACRAAVAWQDGGLRCRECAALYAVEGGVPVMLTPRSRDALRAGGEAESGTAPPRSWTGRLRRALSRWAPGASSYDPGQAVRVAALVRDLGPAATVLDLGSGGRRWGPRVIGMDVDRLPDVHLVGDGQRLPFPDGRLDGVICTGVLEHVEEAEAVTAEMHRVLRAGGLAYVAVPFIQGYHPASGTHHDYRRLTHVGLRRMLAAFEIVEEGVSGGPSSALAWILREYLAIALGGSARRSAAVSFVAGWLTGWIKYLDLVVAHRPAAHRIACGFYVLARKPASPAGGRA